MAETPIYELNHISKHFKVGDVDVPALQDITLSINAGESVALRGPSGSGKSTLLNTLGLIERISGGSLQFLGTSLAGCSDRELTKFRRDSIGFIFQNFNLIPFLSAVENVEYPLILARKDSASASRERALQVLEEVGLKNFVDHRPAQLSGGQRQRVAIARALVKNPKVILADEPTANLDSNTAMQVMELVGKVQAAHNITFIVATHDERTAGFAKRVVQMQDGMMMSSSRTAAAR